MAQWVGALAALAEALDLVPSTPWQAQTVTLSSGRRLPPSSDLRMSYLWYPDIHAGKTIIPIKIN